MPLLIYPYFQDKNQYRWVPLKPDFWEHEILSGLSVIWLIYIKFYKEKEKKIWQEIWAKGESGLTAVWLKRDPPVPSPEGSIDQWLFQVEGALATHMEEAVRSAVIGSVRGAA